MPAQSERLQQRPPVRDTIRVMLRNLAIIAHVDHGKTTLVDALLQQTGSLRRREEGVDRAMDSMDQERERGITILAKHAAVEWDDLRINLVDTPGHADFGGEVERGLTMVDGVLLLVDSSEGPLPQTRFVLRKALSLHLPVVLVINKIDRPDARIKEVVDEAYELFMDLDADDHHIEFPIVYTNARAGTATLDLDVPGTDLTPLLETIRNTIPAPVGKDDAPLQARVANLDASDFVGRLGLCRISEGVMRKGTRIARIRTDGTVDHHKLTELYSARGMERVPVDEARAGDIVAIAGIEDVNIGETIADAENPVALPPIVVDAPSISMTIGINTSPLAGKSGRKLTARMIKNRLDQELVGNVSIEVHNTERPDAWEVHGRGELQLAVLVETMRREDFELTVGKPRVLVREIDGKTCEPYEHAYIDVPDEYVGAITQLFADRRGKMVDMSSHGTGWTKIEYDIPARGLIGIRTRFLTETRGTGQLNHIFKGYDSWAGEIRTRGTGALISDRTGKATGFAIQKLEDRGTLFVAPTEDCYEGMIVGEHVRPENLDVNIVREKKLTNMRSSSSDILVQMTPPRKMSLDEAIEFVREGECLEVTPGAIRMRMEILGQTQRAMHRSKQKQMADAAQS
jgi:GTP-binding protein